jgi:hypothetical protein
MVVFLFFKYYKIEYWGNASAWLFGKIKASVESELWVWPSDLTYLYIEKYEVLFYFVWLTYLKEKEMKKLLDNASIEIIRKYWWNVKNYHFPLNRAESIGKVIFFSIR